MTDIEQEARAYAERHAVATENVETAVQRVVAAYIAGASRPALPAARETVTEEMARRAQIILEDHLKMYVGAATIRAALAEALAEKGDES